MFLAQIVNVSAYLAVSDLEVSMDKKASLLVRFILVLDRIATAEMIRVERDAKAKDRHDGSVCSSIYAPVRVRPVTFAEV